MNDTGFIYVTLTRREGRFVLGAIDDSIASNGHLKGTLAYECLVSAQRSISECVYGERDE